VRHFHFNPGYRLIWFRSQKIGSSWSRLVFISRRSKHGCTRMSS
jgi:hypothetical protein